MFEREKRRPKVGALQNPGALSLCACDQDTLARFLATHHIAAWDVLLFGDGSGSVWEQPCGWASVSIERVAPQTSGAAGPVRRVWYGALNNGTVNMAEALAYLAPLNWLVAQDEDRRKNTGMRRTAHRIHIFTDSQYCRDSGNRAGRSLGKNSVLWAAFDVFKRHGYLIEWHWIRRDQVALNQYVDLLSKLARGLFVKNKLRRRLETTTQVRVADCNP